MRRYGWKCPHCGNRNRDKIEENGSDTVLCVARVEPGDEAHAGCGAPPEPGPDGLVSCGMLWTPNEWRDEG